MGNIIAMLQNLQEGVERGIIHEKFHRKIEDLVQKHNIVHANEMINVQDYENVERSQNEIEKACKDVLKFSSDIQDEWQTFAEYFGRSHERKKKQNQRKSNNKANRNAGIHVAMFSTLTLGAVTVVPKYAESLKEMPFPTAEGKKARDELLGNASEASAVSTFWSKLVYVRHEHKNKQAAAKAGVQAGGAPIKKLQFSPSPKKAKKSRYLKAFEESLDKLVNYDITKESASWKGIKELANDANDKLEELKDLDAKAAEKACDFDLAEKAQEIRKKLIKYQEAPSPKKSPKPVKRKLAFSPSPKKSKPLLADTDSEEEKPKNPDSGKKKKNKAGKAAEKDAEQTTPRKKKGKTDTPAEQPSDKGEVKDVDKKIFKTKAEEETKKVAEQGQDAGTPPQEESKSARKLRKQRAKEEAEAANAAQAGEPESKSAKKRRKEAAKEKAKEEEAKEAEKTQAGKIRRQQR